MKRFQLNKSREQPDEDEIIKEMEIDLYNLEKEAANQGKLLRKHSKIYANKKRVYEEEKTALKILEFEIALDIKKKPKNYGIEDGKVTDTLLKMAIPSDPRWKHQHKKLLQAMEEFEDWAIVVQGTRDRTNNINTASFLWRDNYYGDRIVKLKQMREAE